MPGRRSKRSVDAMPLIAGAGYPISLTTCPSTSHIAHTVPKAHLSIEVTQCVRLGRCRKASCRSAISAAVQSFTVSLRSLVTIGVKSRARGFGPSDKQAARSLRRRSTGPVEVEPHHSPMQEKSTTPHSAHGFSGGIMRCASRERCAAAPKKCMRRLVPEGALRFLYPLLTILSDIQKRTDH